MGLFWRGVLPGRDGGGLVQRRGVMVVVAGAVALVCAGLVVPVGSARAGGAARRPGISWGRAERLRGRPAISGSRGSHQTVRVASLSCWSVNNCVAGGRFFGPGGNSDFAVVERNGRWGRAAPLPGMPEGSVDGWVQAVSCARGGYCVAGGLYDSPDWSRAFVATRRKGRWQRPLQVRSAWVHDHNSAVTAVSCLAARRCVVAGSSSLATFVARQVKGAWRTARILDVGSGPGPVMSCWSPVDCVVAKALTVSELNGVWGTPEAISGAADDEVTAVSCARDGYCAVAGFDNAGRGPLFVASGPDGTFGTAVTLPAAPGWQQLSVSCPSAGNCVAADGSWVVSQTGGVWDTPQQLPGTRTDTTITSLSCRSAGDCVAVGGYVTGGLTEPFVASESNGNWSTPSPVPGITALVKRKYRSPTLYYAVSCPSADRCTVAGTYADIRNRLLGFVTGPA